MRGSFGVFFFRVHNNSEKENKFIVAAHDLQTLAAVPRIKSSPPREAITLDEK